jgi:hypothetical protein
MQATACGAAKGHPMLILAAGMARVFFARTGTHPAMQVRAGFRSKTL